MTRHHPQVASPYRFWVSIFTASARASLTTICATSAGNVIGPETTRQKSPGGGAAQRLRLASEAIDKGNVILRFSFARMFLHLRYGFALPFRRL